MLCYCLHSGTLKTQLGHSAEIEEFVLHLYKNRLDLTDCCMRLARLCPECTQNTSDPCSCRLSLLFSVHDYQRWKATISLLVAEVFHHLPTTLASAFAIDLLRQRCLVW